MSIVNNDQVESTCRQRFEHDDTQQNSKQTVAPQSDKPSLEDEIYILRNKMVQTICIEESLTSASVVEQSSILDRKINEYMKLKHQPKQ